MANIVRQTLILKHQTDQTVDSLILRTECNNYEFKIKLSEKLDDSHVLFLLGDDCELLVDDFCEKTFRLNVSSQLSAGVFFNDNLIYFGEGYLSPKKATLEKRYLEIYQLKSSQVKNEIEKNLYDDEQIASINYYENRLISEDLQFEEQNYKHAETKEQYSKEESIGKMEKPIFENETVADACQEHSNFKEPLYYELKRQQLEEIFSRGLRERELELVVPQSKWVRINHTINRYYVVGIVYKDDKPRYICYGIPGKYGAPPEKLKDFSCFIPSSLLDFYKTGYFVMFQCALSGDKIDITLNE